MKVNIIDTDGIFDATIENNILTYPHSNTGTGFKDFEVVTVKRLCNGEVILITDHLGEEYTFLMRHAD